MALHKDRWHLDTEDSTGHSNRLIHFESLLITKTEMKSDMIANAKLRSVNDRTTPSYYTTGENNLIRNPTPHKRSEVMKNTLLCPLWSRRMGWNVEGKRELKGKDLIDLTIGILNTKLTQSGL